MKHLRMNFNSSLKFANTGLVRPHNANYEVALINAKAQIFTDNRRAHCLVYNVWTEHDYSGDLEV